MAYQSGKEGKVVVGAGTLHVRGWSFDDQVEPLDVTDTGDGGFRNHVPGLQVGRGELTLDYDEAAPPGAAAQGAWITGTTLSSIELHIGTTGGPDKIEIPNALVTGMPFTSTVEGKISLTIPFVTNGSDTTPTA